MESFELLVSVFLNSVDMKTKIHTMRQTIKVASEIHNLQLSLEMFEIYQSTIKKIEQLMHEVRNGRAPKIPKKNLWEEDDEEWFDIEF